MITAKGNNKNHATSDRVQRTHVQSNAVDPGAFRIINTGIATIRAAQIAGNTMETIASFVLRPFWV